MYKGLFDIAHLDKYAIIEEPCTAIVRCNTTLNYDTIYEEDGHSRWIINLKAITADSLVILRSLYKIDKSINYINIGHLFLTGAIWENQIWEDSQLPVKGENVIATFDYVNDKLLCTAITVIPKVNPKLFNASKDILDDIEFFKTLK